MKLKVVNVHRAFEDVKLINKLFKSLKTTRPNDASALDAKVIKEAKWAAGRVGAFIFSLMDCELTITTE